MELELVVPSTFTSMGLTYGSYSLSIFLKCNIIVIINHHQCRGNASAHLDYLNIDLLLVRSGISLVAAFTSSPKQGFVSIILCYVYA